MHRFTMGLFVIMALGLVSCGENSTWYCTNDSYGNVAESEIDGCQCQNDPDVPVTLRRVAAPEFLGNSGGSGTGYIPNPELLEFVQAGVTEGNQKDIFIAGLSQPHPPKAATEILILAQAGNRDPTKWKKGVWNRITGQLGEYRQHFDNGTMQREYASHAAGHAWRVWSNPDETIHAQLNNRMHVAGVYDNASWYTSVQNQKLALANAFTNYVKKHISPDGKIIYLTGSSRGGCVTLLIAKRLKADPAYVDTPLIVNLVDPVCSGDDDPIFAGMLAHSNIVEFYPPAWATNPLNTSYRGYRANIQALFSERARKSLHIRSIVTGDKVIVDSARGFVDSNTPESGALHELFWSHNGESTRWYEQHWVDYKHKFLGRTCGEKDALDAPMEAHYSEQLARFYCEGDSRFNPSEQNCCTPNVPHPDCCTTEQYWSEVENNCLEVPDCGGNGYIEPESDPRVCVDCDEVEELIPAGASESVPQFKLNETDDGCDRICEPCKDFTGGLLQRDELSTPEPECVPRVCPEGETCGGMAPTGQCLCNEGLVRDNATGDCIRNPCQSTFYYYDGDDCIDTCPTRPSEPGNPLHYDCELDQCVDSNVISPYYNPLTGACGESDPVPCTNCPEGFSCNERDECVPDCVPVCEEGQMCGDNGCGGNCGICEVGEVCNEDGQCEVNCRGNCEGRACGDDGCGGNCGLCEGGTQCNENGECVMPCQPNCEGRACGDNGCDGVCGECEDGAICNDAGQCEGVCRPDCEGRECGDNRCGGVCGECADGAICTDDGQCEAVCRPNCEGRACGDNGCDGICGECEDGAICNDAGQCEGVCRPACEGRECGDNRCGGVCGECADGVICTDDGQCEAVCRPNCEGRVCGDNGCDGICGECEEGAICNDAGQCEGVCRPDCEGRVCGDNGCGGSCGECRGGLQCDDRGQCNQICRPNCADRNCGPDGCGGHCGQCDDGVQCTEAGLCDDRCRPNCEGRECGDNGCGGTCGQCADGVQCTEAGLCDDRCRPNCEGRQCGDNGCGGTCGQCRVGSFCSRAGRCE